MVYCFVMIKTVFQDESNKISVGEGAFLHFLSEIFILALTCKELREKENKSGKTMYWFVDTFLLI